MAFTYGLATNRGRVRLLIQDTVEANEFYTDAEIDAFLTLAADLDGEVVRNASAEALEAWASNELMVTKVVTQLDTETDGASVAQEMRMRAKVLREQALLSSTDAGFDIAEMVVGHFSYVEQVEAEAIRDD